MTIFTILRFLIRISSEIIFHIFGIVIILAVCPRVRWALAAKLRPWSLRILFGILTVQQLNGI